MADDFCSRSNGSPRWGFIDLLRWKVAPERMGGGWAHVLRFKDAWVRHNKTTIQSAADRNRLPRELLAGICWIEVAGDPSFIDRVAFEVRAFDWSGPGPIDRHITVTHPPARTSFGAVSIQLRTAAETLGRDPAKMSTAELRELALCLENDIPNIEIVARHLLQLVVHDGAQKDLPNLTMEQIRIIGARYNRGSGLSMPALRKNTSYGDFLVKHWKRFSGLMK